MKKIIQIVTLLDNKINRNFNKPLMIHNFMRKIFGKKWPPICCSDRGHIARRVN